MTKEPDLEARCNETIMDMLPSLAQHEARELLIVLNLGHNGRKLQLKKRLLTYLSDRAVPASALLKCRSPKLRTAAGNVNLPRIHISGSPLPFSELLATLMPLTLLVESKALSAQCQLLQFSVKPEHRSAIAAGGQLTLRFYNLAGPGDQRLDEFPEQLSVRLNTKVLPSDQLANMKGRHAGVPINLTVPTKTDESDVNKLAIMWRQSEQQQFCLELQLLRFRSIDEELSKIKVVAGNSSLLFSSASGDGDLQVACQQASLLCPLSMSRIARPARGFSCRHLQCFDAVSYLSQYRFRLDWRCPVCNLPTQPRQLYIDAQFQGILNSAEPEFDLVEFDSATSWKLIKSASRSSSYAAPPPGMNSAAATSSPATGAIMKWMLADSESESSDMDIDNDTELAPAPAPVAAPSDANVPKIAANYSEAAAARAAPAKPVATTVLPTAAPIVIDLTLDDVKEEPLDNVILRPSAPDVPATSLGLVSASKETVTKFLKEGPSNGCATFATRQEQWPVQKQQQQQQPAVLNSSDKKQLGIGSPQKLLLSPPLSQPPPPPPPPAEEENQRFFQLSPARRELPLPPPVAKEKTVGYLQLPCQKQQTESVTQDKPVYLQLSAYHPPPPRPASGQTVTIPLPTPDEVMRRRASIVSADGSTSRPRSASSEPFRKHSPSIEATGPRLGLQYPPQSNPSEQSTFASQRQQPSSVERPQYEQQAWQRGHQWRQHEPQRPGQQQRWWQHGLQRWDHERQRPHHSELQRRQHKDLRQQELQRRQHSDLQQQELQRRQHLELQQQELQRRQQELQRRQREMQRPVDPAGSLKRRSTPPPPPPPPPAPHQRSGTQSLLPLPPVRSNGTNGLVRAPDNEEKSEDLGGFHYWQ